MAWEVYVGNVGCVCRGVNHKDARSVYDVYVTLSRDGSGRVAGESVALLCDGELVSEYEPIDP